MMVYFDVEAAVATGAIVARSPAPISRLACVPGHLSSLVLSADAGVRRRLEAATELAGWSICDTPADAASFEGFADADYQLVIVDLVHPLGRDLATAQQAAAEIAGRPETLLVVCGDDNAVEHEIWSRCHGAFCHVAGRVSGDALVSLLNKARAVANRHTARAVRGTI